MNTPGSQAEKAPTPGPRQPRYWLPFVVSLATTPVWVLIGLMSAGAGHGHYVFTKLLFPYTMLSTAAFDMITPPFVVIALLQYPAYGVILSLAMKKGRLLDAAVPLALLHGFTAFLAFVAASKYFT
jgi:hypothetical protein